MGGPRPAAPGGESALMQSTARALDSISEGIIILDRDWRFVYVNPAAERFMRKSGAEVLGQTLWEAFPDAASRMFGIEYRRAVAENVPVHFEEFYPEPLNAWYEVRAYPGPAGLSIFFRDITERRETEAALRESEQRYRTILQTAMDGFWMADAQGRLLEVNDAYCRMSGYSAPELLAMRIPDLEAVETAEETAVRIQAIIARGEDRFESQHRRKDGSTFDVEVSVKYWSAGDGRFIGFLRDVTGRKLAERQLDRARVDLLIEKTRLEDVARSLSASEAELQRANQGLQAANEALRRSNETLEARVAERTADLLRRTAQLQALAQDLTRAEERERQRVAQVIHDHLQQLLSVARMNLGMVLDRVRTRSVKESLGSLDGLIAESLDLTRSLTAELSPAILHRSGLAAALQWLGRWYEERFGLKVAVDTEADVELGEELRVTMFRGVRELLFNVVKHANVGNAGVQLRRAADGSTRVVVRDEGVGFNPETLRAWDGGPSHGFGLFSLRERLELLGGRLDVDSAPGQGASFTIIGPPPRPERPGTPAIPPAAPLKAAIRKQTGGRHGRPARRRKR